MFLIFYKNYIVNNYNVINDILLDKNEENVD